MRSVEAPAPGISTPSGNNSLFWCWHIGGAKDAFEDGNAATHNDVVRDILHDSCSLTCH